MATIGYARVSTREQNTDRQTDLLEREGAERAFIEKISGAKKARPELTKMLEFVREGDTLVVESISRLARSTRDLLAITDTLREKGVELRSLKESIDTTTPQGRFMLSIFAALSELERETIRERQQEGIDSARSRGKRFGRPAVEPPANWSKVYQTWKAGEITAVEAMRRTGLSKTTFYRFAKRESA